MVLFRGSAVLRRKSSDMGMGYMYCSNRPGIGLDFDIVIEWDRKIVIVSCKPLSS